MKNLPSAICAALLTTLGQLSAAEKPNVLFIAVDDLNDWIGCLGGHPQSKTPNIDRLAASGVLFRNAYTAAPACNPSRTTVFSGLLPSTSGLYNNLQKLREVMPQVELLPRYFSNQGYWSAGSGKLLHYIIDPASWDDYFPEKSEDDPFPRTFYPKKRPVNLPRGGPWQYVETDWSALDVTDEEFGGDWLVSKWIGEQLQREHDRPFFLGCGIYRPHEPWFVPKKYFEPFPLESIQPGPGYKVDDLADVPPEGQKMGRNRYFEHILKHDQWKQGIQGYLASIHFSDAMVGRVLDALEKSPKRDNTIVVLWSDHGWHLGEKEHWQKFTGWRSCDRVPLIIRVPKGVPGLLEGTQPGSVCDRVVNLVDLFRTLTDLCELPGKEGIDGRSLVPLLRDPGTPWPHATVTFLDRPGNYAVSTEQWRYIHYRGGDEELYDVKADPHEWSNLATKPEWSAQLDEMRSLAPKNVAPSYETQPGIDAVEAKELLELTQTPSAGCPPSKVSDHKVRVVFQNRKEAKVKLVWVDPAGKRHERKTMEGATRFLVDTFAGHVWLILDPSGKELGYFVIGQQSAQAPIQ
jgi:arylsulfatase A-like enzyme